MSVQQQEREQTIPLPIFCSAVVSVVLRAVRFLVASFAVLTNQQIEGQRHCWETFFMIDFIENQEQRNTACGWRSQRYDWFSAEESSPLLSRSSLDYQH